MENARSRYRWRELRVFAEAAAAGCAGEEPASAALDYAWALNMSGAPGFESTSADPRYFSLAADALAAGESYALTVVVTDAAGRTNAASATLTVLRSELTAVIDGGDRTAAEYEGVTLDASRSSDLCGNKKKF